MIAVTFPDRLCACFLGLAQRLTFCFLLSWWYWVIISHWRQLYYAWIISGRRNPLVPLLLRLFSPLPAALPVPQRLFSPPVCSTAGDAMTTLLAVRNWNELIRNFCPLTPLPALSCQRASHNLALDFYEHSLANSACVSGWLFPVYF